MYSHFPCLLISHNSFCVVCYSDVDECADPEVCGTARCENKEGGYDCLCETGYFYDNETKSCLGEWLPQQSETQCSEEQMKVWGHG